MANRKNWALITAIAIPILMLLMVVGSVYWPRQTIQAKTNFLYMIQVYPAYIDGKNKYEIQQGKLIQKILDKSEKDKTKFFIYDVIQNNTKEISFRDAQKFILDTNTQSPDGFEIIHGMGDAEGIFSFFFAPVKNYNTYYLKKNNTGIKLHIPLQFNNSDYYIFRFLGWIKNQGDNSHVY